MAIVGLDHIQIAIPVGGEDEARGFYAGILGFSEVPKPSNLSPSGCWFEAGEVKLHIGVDPDFHPAAKAHPAFLFDDLDQLEASLRSSGYETREDKPVAGYIRFFTSDPFGNRIECMQRSTPQV